MDSAIAQQHSKPNLSRTALQLPFCDVEGQVRSVSRNLSAVLFDMDGTLCDSFAVHYAATNEALRLFGGQPFSKEQFADVCFRQGQKAAEFLPVQGVTADPGKFNQYKDRLFRQLASTLVLRPGLDSFIGGLQTASIPLGIVTNARRKSVDVFLSECWQGDAPAAVVTYENVRYKKPHPEAYLSACRKIGVRPEQCISFEDSPAGVEAAKNAGTYCIAISNSIFSHQELEHADVIIPSFESVRVLIGSE